MSKLSLVFLVGALILVVQAHAGTVAQRSCFQYLKDMALERFKAGVARTAVVSEFRQAVARINKQYEDDAGRGLFNPANEDEAEKHYYQLALAEMDRIKANGAVAEQLKNMGKIEVSQPEACNRGDYNNEMDHDYDMMDMDLDDVGNKGLEMKNELDSLNEMLESEMGWSMTPEARATMNRRARELAKDLVQNEIKELAIAAFTGFVTGGVGGAVSPILAPILGGLKVKLVQYFMNMLMDMLADYFGKPIILEQHSAGPAPAAA